jgi:HEAT repeat protein/cytochrome c2/cbb3-type cytochrome oxidase cytochrome c subunit
MCSFMKSSSRGLAAIASLLALLGCRPDAPAPEDPAAPYRQAFERLGGAPTGAADACLSCHQGALDPAFALNGLEFLDVRVEDKASAAFADPEARARFRRVLREHPRPDLLAGPRSPHAGIGCAECHVTSDRRDELDADRAAAWEEHHISRHPVLPTVALRPLHRTEAACLRCHLGQDPLPGAELLNRGRALYQRSACHACHVTPGMKTREEDLVDGERCVRKPGPPLTSIADKIDKAWANAWLYHPSHFRPTARMPSFFPRGDLGLPPQLATAVPPAQLERYERVVVACTVEYLFDRSEPSGLPDAPPGLLETVDWKIEDQRERGERLVTDLGCLACHRVDDRYVPEDKKGRSYLEHEFATNLFGSGDKFDTPQGRRWLYHWLRDPSRWFPGTAMPRFDLTDAQIGDILQYLLSLKVDNESRRARGFAPWEPREPDVDARILDALAGGRGATPREKMLEVGRKAVETFGCHACHSMGGEWDRLPVMEGPITREFLPGTGVMERMPIFDINPDESNAIVTYLWAQHDAIGAPYRASARAEGARVFEKYNCAGCHVADEVRVFVRENGRVVGADIRYKDPLDDPPRWSVEWLREPQTLEAPAVAARYPHLLPVAAVERHTPARGGTFAARRTAAAAPEELAYRMPPSLRTSGRKFRPEWLRGFLERPFSIRPGNAMRMPAFDFEEGEVEALVAYLRERDGARPEDARGRLTPGEIGARWERLLAAERRLRKDCSACHLVEGKGRDLSVDLGRLHERIQRPWLRAFLEDPAGIYPRTAMPNFEWGPGELDDMADLLLNFDLVRAAKVERGGPEEVVEALASGDPALAKRALERAAGCDAGLAAAALRALEIFRERRSGPRGTIEAALAHPAPAVRRAAVEALSATGAPLDAGAKLLADPDRGVRRAAVAALSGSGEPRFAPALAGRLRDEHADVRELALRALALMNSRGEAAAVAEATRDRDPLLRRAAIDALEHLRAEEQADAVAKALRDPETAVRARAAEALGALGGEAHIEALSAAAREDGSPVVRAAAHLAIARLGGEPIEEALEDPVPSVRAAACVGLIRAGDPRGRAALAELLRARPRDADSERALAAGVSLLGAGDPRVEPGRRSVDEWVERLGASAPAEGRRAAVTLRSGEAAEWRIAIPLASGLAFVRREGRLALVPLEEAIEGILGDDR